MNDDLLALLARHDPVDTDAVRSREAPRGELTEILATEPAGGRKPTRLRRRVSRPAQMISAVATVAVLLAAAVALLPTSGGSGPSDAVDALTSVAATASADASETARSPYTYYRVKQVTVGTILGSGRPFSVYYPSVIEEWVAADGSGRVRETVGHPEWPGPRDEERWRSQGKLPLDTDESTDRRYGPGELTGRPYEQDIPATRELPADPNELIAIFAAEAERSSPSVPRNVKMFEYATSVLLHRGASPSLRAATYGAISQIEGVELIGEMRDPLGRAGTGVGINSDYTGAPRRYTIIFDSETSHPLAATEQLLEHSDEIDSLTLDSTTLEEAGPVDNIQSRPDAGAQAS